MMRLAWHAGRRRRRSEEQAHMASRAPLSDPRHPGNGFLGPARVTSLDRRRLPIHPQMHILLRIRQESVPRMRRRRNHACVRQSHLLAAATSLGIGGLVLIPHWAGRERVLVLLDALMVCYWTKAVAFSPKYSNRTACYGVLGKLKSCIPNELT